MFFKVNRLSVLLAGLFFVLTVQGCDKLSNLGRDRDLAFSARGGSAFGGGLSLYLMIAGGNQGLACFIVNHLNADMLKRALNRKARARSGAFKTGTNASDAAHALPCLDLFFVVEFDSHND